MHAARSLRLHSAGGSAHHEHGHRGPMPDFIRDAPADEILDALVAVRAHGDEVATLTRGGLRDFRARVTAGEDAFHGDARLLEHVGALLDVFAVPLHLVALAQREL